MREEMKKIINLFEREYIFQRRGRTSGKKKVKEKVKKKKEKKQKENKKGKKRRRKGEEELFYVDVCGLTIRQAGTFSL
jgi:hypothetical protein